MQGKSELKFTPTLKSLRLSASRPPLFNLDKLGNTQLLIHSDKSPFFIISKNNADKIIVNFRDEKETEQMFGEIKTLINK